MKVKKRLVCLTISVLLLCSGLSAYGLDSVIIRLDGDAYDAAMVLKTVVGLVTTDAEFTAADAAKILRGTGHSPGDDTGYTVTFYDSDGTTVLASRTGILAGGYAEPPSAPTKSGALFLGWSGMYADVSSDQSVRAVYSDEKNVLIVSSASGKVGDTVDILISIDGSVKTCGFDISLMYDPALTLISYDADLDLDVIANPNAFENGIKLNFSSVNDKTRQRDIILLQFRIGDTDKAALPVTLTMNSIKEIVNNNPVDADYRLVSGAVLVR